MRFVGVGKRESMPLTQLRPALLGSCMTCSKPSAAIFFTLAFPSLFVGAISKPPVQI
jgi:hypothetical protein